MPGTSFLMKTNLFAIIVDAHLRMFNQLFQSCCELLNISNEMFNEITVMYLPLHVVFYHFILLPTLENMMFMIVSSEQNSSKINLSRRPLLLVHGL